MVTLTMTILEVIVGLGSFLQFAKIEEFLVLRIEIFYITMGSIVMDVQLRIKTS